MAHPSIATSPTDSYSTLTHILPFVSNQFHKLTYNHDLYWRHALLRLLKKEPSLWEEGMKRVIFDSECDELRAHIAERHRNRGRKDKRTKEGQLDQQRQQKIPASSDSDSNLDNKNSSDNLTTTPITKEERLLQQGCVAIESHPPRHHTATSSGMYQCLYQTIVLHHLRYQAPVFCMHSEMKLGSAYGLHFFEPRYRLLISEVMGSYPVSARRGMPILPMLPGLFPPPRERNGQMSEEDIDTLDELMEKNKSLMTDYHRPTFIHAHQSPLRRDTPATVVQVEQCVIQPDHSADVFLRPIAYIWLEEIWERPGTGGLVEARGIRMGKDASESYERWCGMRGLSTGDGRGRAQQLPIP